MKERVNHWFINFVFRLINRGEASPFSCRITHSVEMLTSVIQVFYQDKMAAVGHLIANDQLPVLSQVTDHYTCKSSAAVLTLGMWHSKTILTIE